MKADPKVIDFLNTVLTNELTAINQYFLHARMLDHWGVTKLGKHEYQEFDRRDAPRRFAGEADSVPRWLAQPAAPQRADDRPDAEEVLRCDMSLEDKAVADLREAIPYCESVRDFVSRDLFAQILHDEEDHIDFIETQFDLITRIGAQNWMQLNSGASDSD